jgi:2,3-bisphosphoglycerate-dependent phosphoglycerate mutase
MRTVLLMRHGESESNVGLPTSSPTTVILTELGKEQAKCIAQYLKSHFSLDLIVTSSYQRAKHTADPTKLFFRSIPEKEWPVHEFTYLSSMHGEISTVHDRRPLVDAYWEICDPFYIDGPGSESFEQFLERVHQVLMYLKSTEEYSTIAIFSHEQFICALLWLSQRDSVNLSQETMQEFKDFLSAKSLVNGAIVHVPVDNSDEQWQYRIITSHLENLKKLQKLEEPKILELAASGSTAYK